MTRSIKIFFASFVLNISAILCLNSLPTTFSYAGTAASTTAHASSPYVLQIASGPIIGLYHPAAKALCSLINKYNPNIKCQVLVSPGSVQNLEWLASGKVNFAIVQSDIQYAAYEGSSAKGIKPFSNLRSVFAIHGEPFTVVVRADSGINSFDELKGKKISIGHTLSGEHATIENFFHLIGWKPTDFETVNFVNTQTEISALCDHSSDAIITVVGHPNATLREMALTCPIRLIPVTGNIVKMLTQSSPFYIPMTIQGDLYRGNTLPIATFGVQATLVTTTKVPQSITYAVTSTLFNHLDDFKKTHTAFSFLDPEQMLLGNSAPYADGALQYYKEKGWIMHVAN